MPELPFPYRWGVTPVLNTPGSAGPPVRVPRFVGLMAMDAREKRFEERQEAATSSLMAQSAPAIQATEAEIGEAVRTNLSPADDVSTVRGGNPHFGLERRNAQADQGADEARGCGAGGGAA